ncbi:MAG TPA: FtsX-like permease family protein [Micromonosporaceae bacterium]|nr:FtsX-like permease family protein [Micromonosporaceae bacterium]
MTATVDRPPIEPAIDLEPRGRRRIARRAVVRWAWRLFRAEWRQHLLILVLIGAAVGATFVGSAVAADSPPPANAGFGTASYATSLPGSDALLAKDLQTLRQRFGTLDVIENQTLFIPGSVETYALRAQDPHGAFGTPMLNLVSGRYPVGASEVALTGDLAKTLHLKIGAEWREVGQARRVVGIVQNPQSLLDAFALVAPGQVTSPTQVTALFDATGVAPSDLLPGVDSASQAGVINPETVVLAIATVGLLLIGLVAVAGFTVLAQRRLRAIGMLGAVGASDRNIRLVVRANGVVVGVVGTLTGALVGLAAWLAYRPRLQASVHHVIGTWQLPWTVIIPAMVLAIVTSYLAASQPARSMTRVPIVTALSGRPALPRRYAHRSVVPAVVLLVAAFGLLTWSGRSNGNGSGALELVAGFVALTAGLVLLAPSAIAVLARATRGAPVGVRLAIRDLARYRARSGACLAAISVAVLIAVLVCVATAARYANALDYVGPNLSSTQLILQVKGGGPGCDPHCEPVTPAETAKLHLTASRIAATLGSHWLVELDSTSATLQHAAPGRNWSGPLYVATPSLLIAFGISPSAVRSDADIVTMRPGLASTSKMLLVYGAYFDTPPNGPDSFPCPASDCVASPKMQQVDALPSGTSAPNTVITQRAVERLGLDQRASGWLLQTPHPLTAEQIASARQAAADTGLSVETASEAPTSADVLNWATAAGILLALGILAMTIGLIRAETSRDLRTLVATGASGPMRRAITAATAGALAVLGAVLGTVGGYIAAIAWFRSDAGGDSLASLGSVPATNLLIILVGLPLLAAAGGWLFAGRQPSAIAHQPID